MRLFVNGEWSIDIGLSLSTQIKSREYLNSQYFLHAENSFFALDEFGGQYSA